MRVWFVIGAVAAVACTSKVQSVETLPSTASMAAPAAVATAFLQAVADSNLAQMGQLWGTAKGPAAVTGEPADWLKRVAVIHSYLRGGTAKVSGENRGSAKEDRRQLVVELTRQNCVKSIPFTMIRLKDGSWLVNAIDLNAAGVPGRACENVPGT